MAHHGNHTWWHWPASSPWRWIHEAHAIAFVRSGTNAKLIAMGEYLNTVLCADSTLTLQPHEPTTIHLCLPRNTKELLAQGLLDHRATPETAAKACVTQVVTFGTSRLHVGAHLSCYTSEKILEGVELRLRPLNQAPVTIRKGDVIASVCSMPYLGKADEPIATFEDADDDECDIDDPMTGLPELVPLTSGAAKSLAATGAPSAPHSPVSAGLPYFAPRPGTVPEHAFVPQNADECQWLRPAWESDWFLQSQPDGRRLFGLRDPSPSGQPRPDRSDDMLKVVEHIPILLQGQEERRLQGNPALSSILKHFADVFVMDYVPLEA